MKVLIVVRKKVWRDGSYHWNYDILYKPSLIDRLLRRKLKPHELEYEYPESPHIREFVREGWKYFISGDTFHTSYVLATMGLKDERDYEGLVNWLKKRFPKAKIVVK